MELPAVVVATSTTTTATAMVIIVTNSMIKMTVATIGYQGMEEVRGLAVVWVVVAMEVQIIKGIQSAGKLFIV
jgi:hypothetical protein